MSNDTVQTMVKMASSAARGGESERHWDSVRSEWARKQPHGQPRIVISVCDIFAAHSVSAIKDCIYGLDRFLGGARGRKWAQGLSEINTEMRVHLTLGQTLVIKFSRMEHHRVSGLVCGFVANPTFSQLPEALSTRDVAPFRKTSTSTSSPWIFAPYHHGAARCCKPPRTCQ